MGKYPGEKFIFGERGVSSGKMRLVEVSLFDFPLPEAQIALRPVRPRRSARLLHVRGPGVADAGVGDLPRVLRAGDVLVLNDVAVLPARLFGVHAGRRYEVLPVSARGPAGEVCEAFVKGSRRLRVGDVLEFAGEYSARVSGKDAEGTLQLVFSHDLPDVMRACGRTPLPPYILRHRADDADDVCDYQTAAAREPAAVAASTAGLHFDDVLHEALAAAGIGCETLTLAVGAGTFRPVKAEDTDDHSMHAEHACLSAQTAERLNRVRAGGGRIVAVGTTALRTLESAADASGTLHAFDADTALFVTPGYRFKCVDLLLTNFHPPRSTPLMLACAFAGYEHLMSAYTHALSAGYRWCSYGDACLLEHPE